MLILWQRRWRQMIKRLCLLFFLFLVGCASYSTHDIPDVDFDVSSIQIPKEERHDVTLHIAGNGSEMKTLKPACRNAAGRLFL